MSINVSSNRTSFLFAIAFIITIGVSCNYLNPSISELTSKNPSNNGDSTNSSTAATKTKSDIYNGDGASEAVEQFERKIGEPVKALEIVVSNDFVQIQAQDNKKPENIDQYMYRNGELSEAVPVKISGGGKLEDNLFALDEVNLRGLPQIVAEAQSRVKDVEGAKVSTIVIKRGLPFTEKVQMYININATRKNGQIRADSKGKITEVLMK